MAGFRRLVNQNFAASEESVSQNREFYEDSQDPSQFSERTQNDSPSLFTQHYPRTSTPVAQFQLPPRFPIPLGLHDFQTPLTAPSARHIFQPSFFENQYEPETRRPSTTLNEGSRIGSATSSLQSSQKMRNQWTKEQTDAMVNAWRESFVELESHKNPAAWRRIQEAVNKKGEEKTLEQVKKKLSNLKDRYKEAKEKNKRSGAARNMPKYYDVFDDVLGTRSVVQLGEVRETTPFTATLGTPETNRNEDNEGNETGEKTTMTKAQPKRTKKKKASKSAATSQLVDCLDQLQQQQQNTMDRFLEGMKEIEENSRKHTADLLLGMAKIFAKAGLRGKKRPREEHSSDSEESE